MAHWDIRRVPTGVHDISSKQTVFLFLHFVQYCFIRKFLDACYQGGHIADRIRIADPIHPIHKPSRILQPIA